MLHRCCDDFYDKLIISRNDIFEKIHNKKKISGSIININFDNNFIIVPVTINICLIKEKFNIDFIKYSKYIIDTLNDGFSGNILCKYKNNTYDIEYLKNKLLKKYKNKADSYSKIIHEYINKKVDTNIRFYLDSIEYHNINFETEFIDSDTEKLINNFFNNGFKIRKANKYNLNINIIKFKCDTLGVSVFPWMKYLLNIPNIMMIFLDYRTIHPDISNSNYNQCRTLIHEAGHIFGLKHIFYNNKESLDVYKILLGKIIYEREFLKNINNDRDSKNKIHLNDIKTVLIKITKDKVDNKQLYNDIPYQKNPTTNNPIETNEYQIINNNICNFCCFMDYSPDEILTHFTESQKRIMHYFIIIFIPNLIQNVISRDLIKNSDDGVFRNIPISGEQSIINLSLISNKMNTIKYYSNQVISNFNKSFSKDNISKLEEQKERIITNNIKNTKETKEQIIKFTSMFVYEILPINNILN